MGGKGQLAVVWLVATPDRARYFGVLFHSKPQSHGHCTSPSLRIVGPSSCGMHLDSRVKRRKNICVTYGNVATRSVIGAV